MSRQRWELKRLWLPVETMARASDKTNYYFQPGWEDKTYQVWAQAEQLAEDGWELVGMVPETMGHEYIAGGAMTINIGAGTSYTQGYYLVFKRPKE